MNLNPKLRKETIIRHFQDEIKVELLYHPDVIGRLTMLYKSLRDYLDLNEFKYIPSFGQLFIHCCLTKCLFTEQVDKTHAVKFLTDTRKIKTHPDNRNEEDKNISQINEGIRKLAHSI